MTQTHTITDLQSLASQGESLTLEFKKTTAELKEAHYLPFNLSLPPILWLIMSNYFGVKSSFLSILRGIPMSNYVPFNLPF